MDCAHDMLVRLATISNDNEREESEITVRLAYGPEMELTVDWVKERFGSGWASEVSQAFYGHPKRCLVAIKNEKLVGVCAYDASYLGVAGPLGVDELVRGQGVGELLIRRTMLEMKRRGYGYAILGWITPKAQPFFERAVGAVVIGESDPKNEFFQGMLKTTA